LISQKEENPQKLDLLREWQHTAAFSEDPSERRRPPLITKARVGVFPRPRADPFPARSGQPRRNDRYRLDWILG
jgi:hypothetical protein